MKTTRTMAVDAKDNMIVNGDVVLVLEVEMYATVVDVPSQEDVMVRFHEQPRTMAPYRWDARMVERA